ncbi:MAG: aldo/keto reductase [Sphingomicrobium sp.]
MDEFEKGTRMPALHDHFTLANGVRLPKVGFGTWQITDERQAYEATSVALASGYRHIDTARVYGNEASVGRAVRDCGVPRAELFVASKLPAEIKEHDEALASFETTMAAIGLDYVDLYLIHAPWPWDAMGQDCSAGNKAVWKALETVYRSGRAKAIGVSNFNVTDLCVILDSCAIKPMVNQIRFFVGNSQTDVVQFCRSEDIQVTGYSPLATGEILDHPDINAVAERYGVSVAQICIRYAIQKEVAPLPKSTHAERIRQNADVDFYLASADMALLDGLSSS